MHVTRTEIAQLADSLFEARTKLRQCEPLTARAPALSIRDAYTVSEINLKRRLGQGYARLVGKKIGLTSRAVQKQLGVNATVEVLKFSGVVDPRSIGAGNTVQSTQIADARIQFRGQGQLADTQKVGWLGRFFLSLWPL